MINQYNLEADYEEGLDESLQIQDANELIHTDVPEMLKPDEVLAAKHLQANIERPTELAIESFSMFFSGTTVMKNIAEFMESISEKITSAMDNLTDLVAKVSGKRYELDRIMRYSKEMPYFTINKKTQLYIPPKFKGNYLEYSEFLLKLSGLVSTIDDNMVTPLSEYMARIINKPENLANSTFKPRYELKEFEQEQKHLMTFFTGQMKTKALWGEIFKRNEEVPMVVANIKKCHDALDGLEPKSLQKSVNTLSQRANILAKKFTERSGKYQMNPNQRKYFSDLLYATAKAVEFYSVVHQLVYELEQSLVLSQQDLSRKKEKTK